MNNQGDSSDEDDYEPDITEVYFPFEEYKLLTSDNLIIGHNYYVIDTTKNGKHILYETPDNNYSSGPFTYYGKYVESYIQSKILRDLNNEVVFINIYKFYNKDGNTLSDKVKYTNDNFDKNNVELYKTTNVPTYKHSYLYLDEESVTKETPPVVDEVKFVNKTARNIPIPRNTKVIPVAQLLDEPLSDEEELFLRLRKYFGGKNKRKTIRKKEKKNKLTRRKNSRRYKRRN
jgi:hypothetical protein